MFISILTNTISVIPTHVSFHVSGTVLKQHTRLHTNTPGSFLKQVLMAFRTCGKVAFLAIWNTHKYTGTVD